MDEVRTGRIPFCKLDILHRRNLELILPRFHVGTLTEEQRHELNLAWHRLDAWPRRAAWRGSNANTCWRRYRTATFR